MAKVLNATKCPGNELALANCVILNAEDFPESDFRNVQFGNASDVECYVFKVKNSPLIRRGEIGLNAMQRKWTNVPVGKEIEVVPFYFNDPKENCSIGKLVLEVDFLSTKNITTEYIDIDEMKAEFLRRFQSQPFTTGQMLVFEFRDKKYLKVVVNSMEMLNLSCVNYSSHQFQPGTPGELLLNSVITFNMANSYKHHFKQGIQNCVNTNIVSVQPAKDVAKDLMFHGIITLANQATIHQEMLAIESEGLLSVLIEGPPNSGKTALAAKITLDSKIPVVKICSPDDMVGLSEALKCEKIRGVFADAYTIILSVIILDNVERLLGYSHGSYSILVCQTLVEVMKQKPPKSTKLMILMTTSKKSILDELGLSHVFHTVIHCNNITNAADILKIMAETKWFSNEEMQQFEDRLLIMGNGRSCNIGVKKLCDIMCLIKPVDNPLMKNETLENRLIEEAFLL